MLLHLIPVYLLLILTENQMYGVQLHNIYNEGMEQAEEENRLKKKLRIHNQNSYTIKN